MAFNIEVIRTAEEDEYFVYYIYQFYFPTEKYKTASGKMRYKPKTVSGKLKIDKRSGEVHIVELAEGDKGSQAERAGWALIKHWRKGEYPDKTCWAS